MVDEPMSGTLAIVVKLWRSAVLQRSSSWSRPNGPCSPSIKTKSKSSFPRMSITHGDGKERLQPYALRPARMAALTRLDCFILCPHVYGDCDMIVPCCRPLAAGSCRTLHREKRVL